MEDKWICSVFKCWCQRRDLICNVALSDVEKFDPNFSWGSGCLTRNKTQGFCFVCERSSLTVVTWDQLPVCFFLPIREQEKLSHGSSLVLGPCSQILGWGEFMAVKVWAHCFKLSSLEFLYCSTLSSTLETLGFKTKKVITGTIFCASQAVQLGCLSYHQSNCARGGRGT